MPDPTLDALVEAFGRECYALAQSDCSNGTLGDSERAAARTALTDYVKRLEARYASLNETCAAVIREADALRAEVKPAEAGEEYEVSVLEGEGTEYLGVCFEYGRTEYEPGDRVTVRKVGP